MDIVVHRLLMDEFAHCKQRLLRLATATERLSIAKTTTWTSLQSMESVTVCADGAVKKGRRCVRSSFNKGEPPCKDKSKSFIRIPLLSPS